MKSNLMVEYQNATRSIIIKSLLVIIKHDDELAKELMPLIDAYLNTCEAITGKASENI